jgi:hypothetical protein
MKGVTMAFLGTQLAYAKDVLDARARTFDAGMDAQAVEERAKLAGDYAKVVMQIVVSLVVLSGAMYLLLRGNEATQKISSGLIGTVLGYWLR